jgi:hypothetical protein
VFRRCTELAVTLGLLACTTSCELLFGLDGLSDGGCDGTCIREPDAAAPVVDAAAHVEAADIEVETAPEAGIVDDTSVTGVADSSASIDASVGADAPAGDAACTCVEQPPASWQGPAAVWEGSGAPPECTGPYGQRVLDAFSDAAAAPATCTCACAAPAGATCSTSVPATVFSDHTCTTPCDTVVLTAGTCPDVQGTCVNVFGIAGAVQATGGACAPQATKQVPGWSWSGAMRACEPASPVAPACAAGQVCLPTPPPPMNPRPCIFASGDVPCPTGTYSVRHVFFGTASDSRGCTACSCSPATGVTCPATVQQGCGQTGPTFALPTTCASVDDPGSVELTSVAAPTGGSCTPSGGQPTGSLVPAEPTTVCCMP